MKAFKLLLIGLLALSFVAISVAQPTLPHRVYGEFTDDADGSEISGLNVSFNASGSIVATQNTSSEGFYDLYIQGLSSGENVYLFADGSNTTEYVNFTNGSSTALNCRLNSSNLCVDTSDDDSNDKDEDDTGDDTNDNTNDDNNGDDNGGGSTGGGGGGGSPPAGGGFAPLPDDDPVEKSSKLENGEANISLGEVEQDQLVSVEVSDADYLDGFTFTASSSGDAYVYLKSSNSTSLEDPGSDVLHYFEVRVSGIDSFTNGSLAYTLPASVLNERNASPSDVSVQINSGGSWRAVDNSVTYEGVSSDSFRADSGGVDGVFAVNVPEIESRETGENETESTEGLNIQSLTVTPSENGDTASVNLVAVNNRQEALDDVVELRRNGEVVKDWNISLESGETRELSYTSEIGGSEDYMFSAGSESASLTSGSGEDDEGLPIFLIAVVAILILVGAVLVYIYIIEYRQAQELDEVIEGIEKRNNE